MTQPMTVNRREFLEQVAAWSAGLTMAKGELIAVFDADFLPPSDFLRRVVPHFADHALGCVQTRWGHLNRDYSLFTRCQALGIDGHFIIEKAARSRAGMFVSFNGSGGVWRRVCIEDAGGWHWDTLTEDLDLSYRAQLRGWRVGYLPDVVAPAELPAQMSGFKRQQARWAQGTTQTALKMFVPLLRSDQPWHVKLQGGIHLTSYLVLPMMLLTTLLALLMDFSHSWVSYITPWLMIAAVGPPLLYVTGQITGDQDWRDWLGVPWDTSGIQTHTQVRPPAAQRCLDEQRVRLGRWSDRMGRAGVSHPGPRHVDHARHPPGPGSLGTPVRRWLWLHRRSHPLPGPSAPPLAGRADQSSSR